MSRAASSQKIPARSVAIANSTLRWAAWIVGVVLLLFIVASFVGSPLSALLARDNPQQFAQAWVAILSTLNVILIVASIVVVITVVICWVAGPRVLRPALAMIGAGLVLTWVVGTARGPLIGMIVGGYTTAQVATAEFARLATTISVISIVIELAVAVLMIFGAVRLGRRTKQLG